MKLLKNLALVFLTCVMTTSLFAQSDIKSYTFKKGEILDILLLTTKSGTEKDFNKYKKTIFPFGIKKTYKPLPGFGIKKTTQGNIQPASFILGKWDDLKNREEFLAQIEGVVPDFHLQRRNIWSLFNLTYYEMPKNTSFEIDRNKYNVVTSYWKKETTSFKKFKELWLQKAKENGGKKILQLTNGKSPLGYYHNPDILVITQWDSKEEFDVFYKENLKMNHKGVLHINQFVLN
ncbi:hypothetical protein SAMN04487910_4066 [Aquimarina amphilecti]|uniref:DUF1330 domain-containing protein n=1 Tax=Aquimarina amphilecti TaxID=1038014 RepID=A0A1H7VEA7_AQUAM|nr:hypothetical protein [Aquimarina amphilecti]SEM07573.1 hypothetical protein SAMN04487910_4066 [Aquimarina amphilecti]